ncbi:MAG: hypothetical protein VX463_00435 [Pseudomonadota bacterium]|nr:hypothetical protein [Pseudomonadota bacterium]
MSLIADGLMIAAALVSAIYCHGLAGRLRKLRDLDGGVGQAIAARVAQVGEMRTALRAARAAAGESTRTLTERTARAEMAAGRLELLLASLHDRQGESPVNVAAMRAGRSGGGSGGGSGVTAATPLHAVATARRVEPDAQDDPDVEAEPETPADGALDADSDAGVGVGVDDGDSPEATAGSDDPLGSAAAAEAAPPEAAPSRRLFKIEASPTEARAADSGDGVEAAAALRKALEALARETSE